MEAYNILENVINEKDSDENKSSIDELKSKLKKPNTSIEIYNFAN